MQNKRGRPRKEIKYTKTINIRFTQGQWQKIIQLAKESHLAPSVYLRSSLLANLNIAEQALKTIPIKKVKQHPHKTLKQTSKQEKLSKLKTKAVSGQLHFDLQ